MKTLHEIFECEILNESKPISHQLAEIIKQFAKSSTQTQRKSVAATKKPKEKPEMKVGSVVTFKHKPKEGKVVVVRGTIAHDHKDGSFNVDVSNPFMKSKVPHVKLHKSKLTLVEGYDFPCKICGKLKSQHANIWSHKYEPATTIIKNKN